MLTPCTHAYPHALACLCHVLVEQKQMNGSVTHRPFTFCWVHSHSHTKLASLSTSSVGGIKFDVLQHVRPRLRAQGACMHVCITYATIPLPITPTHTPPPPPLAHPLFFCTGLPGVAWRGVAWPGATAATAVTAVTRYLSPLPHPFSLSLSLSFSLSHTLSLSRWSVYLFCLVWSSLAMPWHDMPCHAVPYRAMPCRVMP